MLFTRMLTFFIAAILGAFIAVKAAEPVRVELYYESQWPGCQSFTTGTLKNTLAKQDIADIVSLKLVSFDN